MSSWEQIKREVVEELTPSEDDLTQLLSFADKTVDKLNNVLIDAGIDAVAEFHGSVAHGTWIKGQQDLDVFIIIENYESRDQLQQVLDAVRQGTDWNFTEAYAEHPYLKTHINGYSLDVVPCFRVKGGKLYSATDRTPLHTKWVDEKLDGLGDEVRLLKRFLMTLDLYGAEIKIGGFSGYLCELLVIYYGGFWETVEAASKWDKKHSINFNGSGKRFDDLLTVIDPVDPDRNVASALRADSYSLFIAAARNFTKNPSIVFFRDDHIDVSPEIVLDELKKRPSDILFLVIEESKADVADTLWGQLYKSQQAIERQLDQNGFKVLRSAVWSNEENRHIFVFELESSVIPETVKHMGPPAALESNVRQFIEVYRDNPRTVAGPDLLGDRWFVLVKQEYIDVMELMKHMLADGGRNIGVSRKLTVRILQHHRLMLNEGIGDYLVDGFKDYLFKWLKGRPLWLE